MINFQQLQPVQQPQMDPIPLPEQSGGGLGGIFKAIGQIAGGIRNVANPATNVANQTTPIQSIPSSTPYMNPNTYGAGSHLNGLQAQQPGGIMSPQSILSGQFNHGGVTEPKEIIFHDTAGPTLKSAIETLKQRNLSYNYIIDKDGSIHNLVPAGIEAYHAKGYNNNTVGVSFVGGGGFGNVNPAQQKAAIQLSMQLKQQFPTIQGFAGHRDRSNAGKTDPEGFDYNGFSKATGLQFSQNGGNYNMSTEQKRIENNAVANTKPQLGQDIDKWTGKPKDRLSLLRGYEEYMPKGVWDVNHFRAGYGSDTTTTADGKILTVTKGMQVSKEDAERDLQRRSVEFAKTAERQAGSEVWNKFAPNVQDALTSIAYNYGSLPSRILGAVRSGDPSKIAEAVRGLANDNKGINRKRRMEEAEYILNGQSPDQPIDNSNSFLMSDPTKPLNTSLNEYSPIIPPSPQQTPIQQNPQQQRPPVQQAPLDPITARLAGLPKDPNQQDGINWNLLMSLVKQRGTV